MFSALVGHKSEFVRLLLENGVCIRQFLQHEDTLHNLYTHLPSCLFLRKLAKRAPEGGKIALSHVSDEVRHLLGSFSRPLYASGPSRHRTEMCKDDVRLTVSFCSVESHDHVNYNTKCCKPTPQWELGLITGSLRPR